MKKVTLFLLLSALCLSVPFGSLADDEVSMMELNPSLTATPEPAPVTDSTAGDEPVMEVTPTLAPEQVFRDGSFQLVITAAGDMTIGGDVRKRGDSIFVKELKKQDNDLNFLTRNVRDIFENDDMTILNFESTLTTAPVYKKNNQFVFSAPPEYVSILKDGSIEAVALENNHVMDHGETGLNETKATLDSAGIVWSDEKNMGVYKIHNVSIAMLSYQTFDGRYPGLFEQVPKDVAAAKAEHDLVIVSYHWGAELDYKPNDNQIKLGRLTIDSGADLVLGHHSHRINPIEYYNGKYIVYSLGNFSFAGNTKPSDMSTFLFQIRYIVKPNSIETDTFRIIPSRISSRTDYNDFALTPFTDQRLIDNVINMLKSNSRGLEYAVEHYPVDWE